MIFGPSATINSRVDGINASIKDIDKQLANEKVRLAAVEARYNTQFSALDAMIGSMNSTSTYLTQQLAALPKSS